MAEEQACLVRARSDSESSSKLSFGAISRTMTYAESRVGPEGSGEPNHAADMAANPPDHNPDGSNESGELLDYNDASVLEQFHEDALRQAGCGLSQARVVLASGLANMGAALELAAIPFILPSAEMELCILPHEKNWLVLISLVGCSLGSVGWGVLSERLGRRRTLLSCLAVNAVFAAIAAFMPTYGTFMMARFCSAIGSGGIVPTTYTYTAETAGRPRRQLALAVVLLCSGAGVWLAHVLANAVLPLTGASTLIENKEHFSAWHRYLLLCTLPILASLISLIWTQESPRFLLDVGREVDAMMVYQSIHSGNQLRICGKRSAEPYRASELALPGKRRPPALHHVRHSVKMFWQSFFQLFSTPYRNTTLSLGGVMVFTLAIQFYLSSYIPTTVLDMEHADFEASKTIIHNTTLTEEHYNRTLENIEFYNVTFSKCVFRDALMSHVAFKNCSFDNVQFLNIKTSYTAFEGCYFFNSTIIDTDMELGRELDDGCVLNATSIRGMQLGCPRHADLRPALAGRLLEHALAARALAAAAALALLPAALRPLVPQCAALVLLSPAVYFARTEHILYILEAVYRLFLTLIFFTIGVFVVETYPANLRCTAHGLILAVGYMCAAVVRGCGPAPPAAGCVLCCVLAVAATALAARR
ncbi:synaptic vesicle glycoprotein 2C-like [Plodia interpunctella]|uniref:synaptic vesicle glycoprotein 2C-like n=1 Tax=Plodia interpunctella TaxID=58824 RepID=UPI0023686F8E|nr:synaptic vesicle glycoprotein 2C-like [Plodia interpunctella]XP_053621097.1 synaptic vesicle glycoprotein 2C-like [Plodia interpunctella]XP_053621098.1 synaptic vesicle glycoprotein 2C-like [Plodia interpunctella]XP_053621099.1 synaptic vesicle glycoprotein 2C-like [Plodia interpunctella]XP_053621100.1 synaptic vesicle glycoprotein 2C-like [Plodia interpunctella]XP_053621101.1 synaptic vesicle glycoprotein 2C-like [Plodia interpunctella]XP_053621102.1 synaptic vesicle glycoprotein 2C-like 